MEELIIKEREFKEKLVKLVNESKLPAIILKPIFKEIFEQITVLEQEQYDQAYKEVEKKNKGGNSKGR